VRLYRCFPWDADVQASARGGALWFPRMLQGAGRHDNPQLYGCLYTAEAPVSALVERFQGLRGTQLERDDLSSWGRPLALAAVSLPDEVDVVDLDEPGVLALEELRPSLVATGERARSQGYAAELYERHPEAAGLRWWSTFESQWLNVTLFDRAADAVKVEDVHALALDDEVLVDAARFLGLPVVA
jgi:RES domain